MRVFLNHELRTIADYTAPEPTSPEDARVPEADMELVFGNGARVLTSFALLNFPMAALKVLDRSAGPLARIEGLDTMSELFIETTPAVKQYVRYEDAWWFTELGLEVGDFTVAPTGDGTPGMRIVIHDQPVRCASEEESCPGILFARYVWGAEWVNYFNDRSPTPNEPFYTLQRGQSATADDMLLEIHEKLLDYFSEELAAAGVDPSTLAPPTSSAISMWSADIISPALSASYAGTAADPEWALRNGLFYVGDKAIFITNEAMADSHSWAEGSLRSSEKVLASYFNLPRPNFVSTVYYNEHVTTHLVRAPCVTADDCSKTGECSMNICVNNECVLDIFGGETCESGDLCHADTSCSDWANCAPQAGLECDGDDVCVSGECVQSTYARTICSVLGLVRSG